MLMAIVFKLGKKTGENVIIDDLNGNTMFMEVLRWIIQC